MSAVIESLFLGLPEAARRNGMSPQGLSDRRKKEFPKVEDWRILRRVVLSELTKIPDNIDMVEVLLERFREDGRPAAEEGESSRCVGEGVG